LTSDTQRPHKSEQVCLGRRRFGHFALFSPETAAQGDVIPWHGSERKRPRGCLARKAALMLNGMKGEEGGTTRQKNRLRFGIEQKGTVFLRADHIGSGLHYGGRWNRLTVHTTAPQRGLRAVGIISENWQQQPALYTPVV